SRAGHDGDVQPGNDRSAFYQTGAQGNLALGGEQCSVHRGLAAVGTAAATVHRHILAGAQNVVEDITRLHVTGRENVASAREHEFAGDVDYEDRPDAVPGEGHHAATVQNDIADADNVEAAVGGSHGSVATPACERLIAGQPAQVSRGR